MYGVLPLQERGQETTTGANDEWLNVGGAAQYAGGSRAGTNVNQLGESYVSRNMSGIARLMADMEGMYRPVKTSHEEEDTDSFDREFDSTAGHFSTPEDERNNFSTMWGGLKAENDITQHDLTGSRLGCKDQSKMEPDDKRYHPYDPGVIIRYAMRAEEGLPLEVQAPPVDLSTAAVQRGPRDLAGSAQDQTVRTSLGQMGPRAPTMPDLTRLPRYSLVGNLRRQLTRRARKYLLDLDGSAHLHQRRTEQYVGLHQNDFDVKQLSRSHVRGSIPSTTQRMAAMNHSQIDELHTENGARTWSDRRTKDFFDSDGGHKYRDDVNYPKRSSIDVVHSENRARTWSDRRTKDFSDSDDGRRSREDDRHPKSFSIDVVRSENGCKPNRFSVNSGYKPGSAGKDWNCTECGMIHGKWAFDQSPRQPSTSQALVTPRDISSGVG